MLRLQSSLLRGLHRNCKLTVHRKSTKAASINQETNTEDGSKSTTKSMKTSESLGGGVRTATVKKIPSRMPLVKNFFLGQVDKELLGFPEVISREDMEALQNQILPLKNVFVEAVNAKEIDATRTIPTNLLESISSLGLYGLNVPRDFDGKGLEWSESLIASEPDSNCTDVALCLLSHRVIIDVLKVVGTEDQQNKFLRKLGNGSLLGTEAIYEFQPAEDSYFNTTATYEAESNSWNLNGEKSFVVTGPLAPGAQLLMLVIAETRQLNVKGDAGLSTTIFLIDSNNPGIQFGEQHSTIGCRGVQMRKVRFDNVLVPESCIFGQPNGGDKVADLLLRSNRLRNSIIGVGLAKNILKEITEYSINSKQCGTALREMESTRSHLTKTYCAIYAMESMIYMTAGLLDEFEKPDVALEAAITKYFTLNELKRMTSSFLEIVGPKSLHFGQTTDIAFRNAAQLCTQGETLDTLRLFIALTGLQHAGVLMNDNINKQRNPLFHPGYIFSKMLQRSNFDNPRTHMRLKENLHPSLEPAAISIEHSVERLKMCVDVILTRHGNKVIEHHNELERLAEIASLIYAMFASAARASRSYCIGLPLSDYELVTATTICAFGCEEIKHLSSQISYGPYLNNDINLQRLSKQLIKSKGHYAVHPLTYNF